jgi:hypothetical protein
MKKALKKKWAFNLLGVCCFTFYVLSCPGLVWENDPEGLQGPASSIQPAEIAPACCALKKSTSGRPVTLLFTARQRGPFQPEHNWGRKT